MKVALLVADKQIQNKITRYMSFMCGEEVRITPVAQADLLISDRPKHLLEFVDAGKLACQVLYAKDHEPLPVEKPNGHTRPLRIFAFGDSPHLHSFPDMRSMVAHISGLALPLSEANDSP